jgi:nitroimidazol reductase NimA-like FMN-containing flavoprotein (pyridoxamine 5'-phosphate oxidase superfamily)
MTSPEQVNRHRERALSERAALDAVLDAGVVGTLSTVVDGRPWVVPMLYARLGDRVVLHGSTGAGALRHVAAGAPAALCVVHLDGVVVAQTTFESSANYRSAVVHGALRPLDGDDKVVALEALSNTIIPGRTGEVRAMLGKELAATLALELPITDGAWTVKIRTGPPSPMEDDATEAERTAWTGVVPLRTVAGEPEPTGWCPPGTPVPDSVRRFTDRHR